MPTYSTNRMQTRPGSTFTTDADGNVTSKTTGGATTTYYWSPDGLLDSVKTATQVVRYDYDAFGLLVRRWTSASGPDRHFLWDQGHLVLELDGALANRVGEYAYLPGTDKPVALLTGPLGVTEVRVIYQDVQGNVHALWKTSGAADRYQTTSDPWGVTGYGSTEWTQALPDTMRLRWQGLLYEGAPAGLYYARARWYDSAIKRFLSPDPLGVAAGVNPYLFAGNDPVNLGDPSGLRECTTRELLDGYGTIPDAESADGTACIKIGGGQPLGTVTVRGGRDPSGFSKNFGRRGPGDIGSGGERGPGAARGSTSACPQVPLAPANASVQENMARARTIAAHTDFYNAALWYRGMVAPKRPWDYKQSGREYAPFGNFNYGATLTAMGYPQATVLAFAGAAQWASDHDRSIYAGILAQYRSERSLDNSDDIPWIQAGITYASNECR